MAEKIKAIRRRIGVLEAEGERAKKSNDPEKLFLIDTEMHILQVYLENLERILKDSSYENRQGIDLKIDPKLLEKTTPEIKMSILCLTEGVCGI